MEIDKLQSETPEDAFARLAEAYHNQTEKEKPNASGLKPVVADITDTCSTLMEQLEKFSDIHDSLKHTELNPDIICDASYGFHKISYMLAKCVEKLKELDTSWYKH